MQIQLFFITMTDDGSSQKAMQDFMRTHKIIHISHEVFSGGDGLPTLIYELRYVDGERTISLEEAKINSKRDKYEKEIEEMKSKLSQERLAIFDNLTVCRKTIAQEDSLSVNYHVFSDKELLYITQLDSISESAITTIKNMTKERAKKYATRLLDTYDKMFKISLQMHISQTIENERNFATTHQEEETEQIIF